jgi:ParB family chromosome partitioning protein
MACAAKQFDAERQAWVQRLPRTSEAVLPWLLEQEHATVMQLLTLLVASSVTGVSGVERDKQSTDALATALNLDMTKWWAATGASYLSHVSKSRILDVVTEAVDANAASPLAALKKDDAVKGAEQTIAGTGWLPTCLRTKAISAAPADADEREASEEHSEPVAVD